MPKSAKTAALKQTEEAAPGIATDIVSPRQKQEADKAALQAAKKLRLSVRLQKGEARRRWEEAKKSIDDGNDVDYNNTVQLKGVFSKLLEAISNGEPVTISVEESPRLDIPADRQEELARSWAEQIAEARAPAQGRTALCLPDAIADEAKYKPRHGVVEFLETGWPAPYIKAGILSRPDLRRLDPQGAVALENWLKNPKHALPDHLRVPKKVELVDREITDPDRLREARRLIRAHDRRQAAHQK